MATNKPLIVVGVIAAAVAFYYYNKKKQTESTKFVAPTAIPVHGVMTNIQDIKLQEFQ